MTYREARKKAGLTMDEAAERLGVSRVSLWLWETGRGNPLIANLVKMAEVYNVAPNELSDSDATRVKMHSCVCCETYLYFG